jgi:hypothetical protein
MSKIFCEAFSSLKFSPFVSNAFPLTKQNSPSINSPLSVQEGFKISGFENTTCSLFRTQRDTNLKFTNEKTKLGWWCGPFALGQYFLPLWHESPKTDTWNEI